MTLTLVVTIDLTLTLHHTGEGPSMEECERLAVSLRGLEGMMRELDLPGQAGYILGKRGEGREEAKAAGADGEGRTCRIRGWEKRQGAGRCRQ